MNFGVWAWVAFAVLVVAPFVTGALCFHIGRHHERTEGKHRRTSAELDRGWDEWRDQMRAPWDEPEIRAKTGRLPTGKSNYTPGDFRPDHITAADIRRVVVPLPGTPVRPQPAPDPEPHTRGLPALTDTGEIRALSTVTDAWLEGMRQKGLIT